MDYSTHNRTLARWASENEIKSSLLRIRLDDDKPPRGCIRYNPIPVGLDGEPIFTLPISFILGKICQS